LIEKGKSGENTTSGIGIESMKERAEPTGGLLMLPSAPDKGTVVYAMLSYNRITPTS
jgi:signal transduction histidine kinase